MNAVMAGRTLRGTRKAGCIAVTGLLPDPVRTAVALGPTRPRASTDRWKGSGQRGRKPVLRLPT